MSRLSSSSSSSLLALVVVVVFAFACLSGSAWFRVVHAVQFDVDANSEKCFMEEFDADEVALGEYNVLPGFGMVVEIKVMDPKGHAVFFKENAEKGKFAVSTPESGEYRMCFKNSLAPGMKYAQNLRRRVELNIRTGVDAKDYTEVARAESLKPIEIELRKMNDGLNQVHQEMLYMRSREEAMRNTNESTNIRVVNFSLFGMVVLVALALIQMYYLKRYFQAKKLL